MDRLASGAISPQDVRAAWAAAWAFLRALESEEADEAFLARLSPDARAWCRSAGGDGTYASLIRDHALGIAHDVIDLLGTYSSIELYEGPICRFRFMPTGSMTTPINAGKAYLSWRLDVELHDGRWLVHPFQRDRGPKLGEAKLASSVAPDDTSGARLVN